IFGIKLGTPRHVCRRNDMALVPVLGQVFVEPERPRAADGIFGREVIGKNQNAMLAHPAGTFDDCLLPRNALIAATLRCPARPSHSGGVAPVFGVSRARFQAWRIVSLRVPARILVPHSIVMGRSVFSRRVKHGTPSTVDSS